jgi:hypothetical protein
MDSWGFSHPNPFPTSYESTRLRFVLSPFWSDVDIRREGTVRYVLITRSSSDLGELIIDNASRYINERFLGEDALPYHPTWVLVAQWDGVHPHPHGSGNHEGIDEKYLNRVSTIHI